MREPSQNGKNHTKKIRNEASLPTEQLHKVNETEHSIAEILAQVFLINPYYSSSE